MSDKPFNAFISYSRKDGVDFVHFLRKKLIKDEKGKELKLWKDREQMEGDVGWWQQIIHAIDQAEYLILVLTPESLRSGVCQKEWRYARQVGVCVVPVKGVLDMEINYNLLPGSMKNAHIYDIHEEWAKFVNDLCRSCQVKKVPFMAPDMPKDFVPRVDIMNKIRQQLLKPNRKDNVALTSALRGAGGFGKTTLATTVCYDEDIQDHFSAGILWVTIGEEGNPLKEITKLCKAITGEDRHFVDIEEGARTLSELLEQGDYLLVVDDVWKYRQLEPFLLKAKSTVRLITTRVDEVVRKADAAICQVNEMEKQEAFQMLAKGWKLDREDTLIVEQLIDHVGEWPLLLKLMRSAALARIERGQSIRNTLNFLKENYGRKGLMAFDARSPESRNDAVSDCIGTSLKMLTKEQQQQCIGLGIFPTDTAIPAEVIYGLWEVDSFDGENILMELDEYALLDFDMSKGAVSFHDVLLYYYHHTLGLEVVNKHKQLIKSWTNPYDLPDMYAWQFYLWHLGKAEEHKEMENLLMDYKWLKKKLEKTGIHAILMDYSLVSPKTKTLELLYKAFRMSAHVLAVDKSNLALQLHERLRFDLVDLPFDFYYSMIIDLNDAVFTPISTSMLTIGNLIYTLNLESRVTCCITWQDKAILGLVDGTIRVTYKNDGKVLHQFTGHFGEVTCLAVSGDMLVSGSDDSTLRSWELSTGRPLHQFIDHTEEVMCLAVSGDILVSGSWDSTIRSWELSTGRPLHQFTGHRDAVSCLAVSEDILVSGSWDSTIRSWVLSTGRPLHQFIGHFGEVTCFAVSGDILVSGSDDSALKSWELFTGRPLHQFIGHTDAVMCLAVSGDILVSGSNDRTLRSWELLTGRPLQEFTGHTRAVRCLAVSGDILVSGSDDRTLRSWELSTGRPLQEFTGHTDAVSCLAVSGDMLVSGSWDSTLRSWELSVGKPLLEFTGHTYAVSCLAVSGDMLVSGSDDKTLRSWELSTGRPLQEFTGHIDAVSCITVIGDILVSGSWDSTLRSWVLSTGRPLQEFTGHTDAVSCVTVIGDMLVSGSDDSTLRSWELSTGRPLHEFTGHTRAVSCVTVIGDILVSGSNDRTLRSWELSTGRLLQEFTGHTDAVSCVTVIGDILVSGSWDRTLRSWELSTGRPLNQFTGHTGAVSCLAVSGDILVSGSWDRTLRSWELSTGIPLQKFTGHTKEVSCLVVLGDMLVSGSLDSTLRSWKLKSEENTCCLFTDEPISEITFETTKCIIVVGGKKGGVYFFEYKEGFM